MAWLDHSTSTKEGPSPKVYKQLFDTSKSLLSPVLYEFLPASYEFLLIPTNFMLAYETELF